MPIQRNFASGELDPSLHSRVDLVRYQTGLRKLRNAEVMKTGGVRNRAGMKYVMAATSTEKKIRLLPFVFSRDQAYLLEFSDKQIRVIRNDVVKATITAPYLESDLAGIQYAQSNDILFLVHSSYPPKSLSRYADDSWILATVSFVPSISAPTELGNSGGAAGTSTSYVVTAVKTITNEESVVSSVTTATNKYATTASPITISWTASTGAQEYNAYKNTNEIYGYIGTAGSTSFIDDGIDPDTSECPPVYSLVFGSASFTYNKLGDLPEITYQNRGPAFSPDDTYLAVGLAGGNYLAIYKRDGTEFTLLASPDTLPTGIVYDCAWDSTGTYLAIACAASPNIIVYKRSGDTFVKLSDPSPLPAAGNSFSVSFGYTTESRYISIAVGGDGTKLICYMLDTSADTFSEFTIDVQPGGFVYGVSWCVSGTNGSLYLAASHSNGDYLTWYKRNGLTLTKLSAPANKPTGNASACEWDADGVYLAVAHATTPYVSVYKRTGDTIAKLSSPTGEGLPPDAARGCSWTQDSAFLCIAHSTSPYITIYSFNSGTDTFTKSGNPVSLPNGFGYDGAYSNNGRFLAFTHATSPYIIVYYIYADNPSTINFFQQRLMFANSEANPDTIWTSRSSRIYNFTSSSPMRDDDSIRFTIASRAMNEVKQLLDINKLILMTTAGIYLVKGDTDGVLKPTAVNLERQSYNSCSDIIPLIVDSSAIFLNDTDNIVRDLLYEYQTDGYRGNELSVFASHLFNGHKIVAWAYQQHPDNIIRMVRDDGVIVNLTYVKEQQIIGWGTMDTGYNQTSWYKYAFEGKGEGYIEDVCVIPDGDLDAVYFSVIRLKVTESGTIKCKYIEKMMSREMDTTQKNYRDRYYSNPMSGLTFWSGMTTDNPIFLDSYVTVDNRNETTMYVTANRSSGTDDWYILASSPYFTAGDVGKEIHIYSYGEGYAPPDEAIRCEITAYNSTTNVSIKIPQPNPETAAHRGTYLTYSGTHYTTWAKAVKTITGLDHLEGRKVAVIGDGTVVANPLNPSIATTYTVSGGSITLDRCYAVIHVGMPYVSDVETLGIDDERGSATGKSISIHDVTLKLIDTKGLWIGNEEPDQDGNNRDTLTDLEELPISPEEYQDGELFTGDKSKIVKPAWRTNGRIFIRQIDPLPFTLTGIKPEITIGT